ncbi:MAG: toxin C-terminal domain-containing protein, partial [Bacteroidota bacterium]
GRMVQGIFANAASRGFTIEVGELQRAGTIYDREHLEFLRTEYNREVLGRGVLTSEELIARIHQAQKDFDDFTGISTIVTLPGGGMVMKGGLKLAARALQIRRVTRGGTQPIKSLGAAARGFSKVKIPKGFKQVKDFGYQHGQKVYKYKGKYYSRDIDGHNGGVWKVFENVGGRLKRIGTADGNLNIFKN